MTVKEMRALVKQVHTEATNAIEECPDDKRLALAVMVRCFLTTHAYGNHSDGFKPPTPRREPFTLIKKGERDD